MITSLTWGEYFFYLLLFLFIYYSIVSVLYYKWELLSFAGIKRIDNSTTPLSTAVFKEQFITKPNDDATILVSLESELHALFTNCSDMIAANVLLQATNKVLHKYPKDLVDAHRKDLGHFILTETNLFFPGLVGEREVEQLWFG